MCASSTGYQWDLPWRSGDNDLAEAPNDHGRDKDGRGRCHGQTPAGNGGVLDKGRDLRRRNSCDARMPLSGGGDEGCAAAQRVVDPGPRQTKAREGGDMLEYDARGRCVRHPHVQLRKKKMFGRG